MFDAEDGLVPSQYDVTYVKNTFFEHFKVLEYNDLMNVLGTTYWLESVHNNYLCGGCGGGGGMKGSYLFCILKQIVLEVTQTLHVSQWLPSKN